MSEPFRDPLSHEQRRARRPRSHAKLMRSSQNRILTGVMGGIAEFIGANSTFVRGLFVLACLLTLGVFLIPYVLMWWWLPLADH